MSGEAGARVVDAPERAARAAVGRVVEPGTPGMAALVASVGAITVLDDLRAGRSPADPSGRLARRAREVDGTEELARGELAGLRFICPGDSEWPGRVDDLGEVNPREGSGGPPLGLWVRGGLDLAAVTARSVAVVGARAATSYGCEVAADICAELGERAWTVVSGAAYGIDAAGHRGALAVGAPTVAVLACGADRAYPKGNASLLERITAEGLVVAELPPGTHPSRARFLARNRLIAAMTPGTVVVEAALRSGARSTYGWAVELSREVMAVPGPVTSAMSSGPHLMLRDGARIVTRAADVVELLGELGPDAADEQRGSERPWDGLPPAAVAVLEAFPGRGAVTLETLVVRTGMDSTQCQVEIGRLGLLGLVEDTADGWRLGTATRAARRAARCAD